MTTHLHELREALPNLPFDEDGPVFHAPWEAQAFAMTLALYERGVFTWQEWAHALSEAIRDAQAAGDPDHGDTYYAHWLSALERISTEKGCTSEERLRQRRIEWDEAAHRTPHGQPIELRRSLSDATLEAYRGAVYRIFLEGEARIDMRIDEPNEAVIALLKRYHATSAVFVTAYNPFGVLFDEATNEARQQSLANDLLNVPALKGIGFDPNENPPHSEASIFALNVSREAACALMQKFEQNAVVLVDERGVPELLLHPIYR
ncbi:nitrile hydratase accessory protein [Caballeronia sp. BR00000012568055]|uniref:nitrile hydratase accessory protein n=1 Tax=Caballeronia sp. BR00000012568055 TaxID=2918761 RepID=UPI0023F66B0E|nr:nitrile hydratase accessory protein [Caballeronia sp. BR00000012568055]